MKQSYRTLGIIVALGLLVAVFGVGPALAKQVDLGDLGVLDASHAPQAAVPLTEDVVDWADSTGEAITFVKPDVMGVFFIKDGALETTKTGTATWGGANVRAGTVFSLSDGLIGGAANAGTYTLVAPSYASTSSTSTPLLGITSPPTVTSGGLGQLVVSVNDTGGSFTLATEADVGATTTVAFSHHLRDTFAGSSSTLRRAKVTSTSDPQGEYVTIMEVAGIGAVASGNLVDATTEAATTTTDGLSVTVANVPIVDMEGADGDVDALDVVVTVDGSAVASSTISSINVETGKITFGTAQATNTAATITYRYAESSPTSDTYRGDVLLTSDAAAQGTNSDGVWVQDGDTLTVTYLNSAGTAIDTDTVTVDSVKPSITAISPADGTITNVTNPTVQFDVTDTGSGLPTTSPGESIVITINGTPATDPSFQAIASGFRVIFASGTSWITTFGVADGTKFTWKIVASDVAGNTKTIEGTDLEATIDITKPTVTEAVTGTAWDKNLAAEKTGDNTAVRLTLSEDVDVDTVVAADITVAGVVPSAVIVGTKTGFLNNIYLTVAAQAPDARPEVAVVAEVKDLAGNILDTALATAKTSATDGLKPAMTVTVSAALGVEKDKIKITVDATEKLATDAGITVSIIGPAGAAAAGLLTTTSPSPQKHEGTFTVAAGTLTGRYGVSIQAKDLGGNLKDNLTAVTGETVATASVTDGAAAGTVVVKVANGPIADTDFDGDVDAADITSLVLSGDAAATTTAITAVDASAQTITVTAVDAAIAGTATVSYKYPKTDTFQVDQTAPVVVFDPLDDVEVQNQSPFIRLTFTGENEYPGDTFKKVTLTKADVLMPDGTTVDLLPTTAVPNFVTTDSVEYIWAASGLALGTYKLTISGQDEAGNKFVDSTSDFIIEARALYEVALRPGWNLVSLPDAPADTAINAVVTEAKIDVVLGYDPTVAGGWLTAVRDAAGNLSGTLSTIEAGKGYWVHTTTFDPITVDIPGLTAGAATIPPSFSLSAGWNLISVGVLDITTLTRETDEYLTGLKWTRVYSYTNQTNKFASIIPLQKGTDGVEGNADDPALTVGQGYWVFAQEAGTLVP